MSRGWRSVHWHRCSSWRGPGYDLDGGVCNVKSWTAPVTPALSPCTVPNWKVATTLCLMLLVRMLGQVPATQSIRSCGPTSNMALVLLHQVVARCPRLDHWQRTAPSLHVLVGGVEQQNTFYRMIAGLQVRSQADLQMQLTSTCDVVLPNAWMMH